MSAALELDPRVVTYLEGGAGDGSAVRANEEAWGRWRLRPRMFRDVSVVDTATTLFGIPLAAPVFAAPWAGHHLVHPEGELATARGLAAAGLGLGLSSGSGVALAEVGAVSGPFLQQLYLPGDRGLARGFLEAAAAAGAAAIALTVDNPGIAHGLGFRAGVAGLPRRPSPDWPEGVEPTALAAAADLGPADIAWVGAASGLPVLAKGVLRGDDAQVAVEAGAAGIIVSNHGGRQLGGSVTTAEVLPEIVEAVAGAVPVLVDGGVRHGEDVVRALALGADAVLVGRPFAWALAEAGAAGVTALADRLVAETRMAMALCGAARLSDLTPDLVRR